MDDTRRHLVVVAEDDELLRLDARLSLEDEGFAVIEASDAATALSVIQQHAGVDALFTDVQMPGDFCGLDLARRAYLLRPGLTVFVTSGEVRVGAGDLPCRGRFFSKPYEMAHVAKALRAAVV